VPYDLFSYPICFNGQRTTGDGETAWTLLFPADVQKEGAIHEKHEKNGWGVGTEKDVIRYKVL